MIEINPHFVAVYPSLIQAYLRKGMFQQALDQLETLSKLIEYPSSEKLQRAYIYAAMGKTQEARSLLAEVEAVYAKDIVSPCSIALVHFILGETDAGFEWLERGYETYDANVISIGVEYELDGVRSDPRYLRLLDKVGLKQTITSE